LWMKPPDWFRGRNRNSGGTVFVERLLGLELMSVKMIVHNFFLREVERS
jgi:hypothetical protein